MNIELSPSQALSLISVHVYSKRPGLWPGVRILSVFANVRRVLEATGYNAKGFLNGEMNNFFSYDDTSAQLGVTCADFESTWSYLLQ